MKAIRILFALVLIFAFAAPGYGSGVKRKKNKWLATKTDVTACGHEDRASFVGW
jgi:hypothetical protein